VHLPSRTKSLFARRRKPLCGAVVNLLLPHISGDFLTNQRERERAIGERRITYK
jgi:hypothetical protein